MSEQNQIQINLLDYSYPEGTMVEIPGRLLEGLIQLLNEVDKNETTRGFINNYPKTSTENFRDENFLSSVDVEWETYPTAESWFSQQPQEVKTLLGVMNMDLLLLLKQAHLSNIENNIAVKRDGTFEEVKLGKADE